MAKTKAVGSTRLGRDSIAKRLGVKLYAGQYAAPGNILVRQRGTSILPGCNVRRGADDTLYAALGGTVSFRTIRKKRFDGSARTARVIEIIPKEKSDSKKTKGK